MRGNNCVLYGIVNKKVFGYTIDKSYERQVMEMRKVIPIGHEDFKRIIDDDLYYVDKTLMIKDIVDAGTTVGLFTRPRRFGKTLNLSMIRRFFEDERDREGNLIDNGYLFDSLAISDAGETYTSMQQQHPVIKLSLKSAKQRDYDMAYLMLKKEIVSEFDRHAYILQGDSLNQEEQQNFRKIMAGKNDDGLYYDAIRTLSQYLKKYHGKNAVILIDEYDVPLENAYFRGFYDEMIDFIRSLFESALKTNDSLEFGIITGCLRISRESIFTGLNNLFIQSLRGTGFGEAFGFTQAEVDAMLGYYGLEEKREEMKDWYDGYLIDGIEIYNPWSVLNYVKKADLNPKALPEAYWANTSSNDIIRELVENADKETREEMERLINGETIEKPIHEEITYGDIHQSMDNLWNFLFFTGYMKNCGERLDGNQIYMKMAIPNREICSIYEYVILNWFDRKLKGTELGTLYAAIENGDAHTLEDFVTEQLQDTISFFDYAENYYHGFLSGLLTGMPGFQVLSNRENGSGRPDLIIKSSRIRKVGKAMIIEVKLADSVQAMEAGCEKALQQIEEKHYAEDLLKEGYQTIMKYGICFYKKECMVQIGESQAK